MNRFPTGIILTICELIIGILLLIEPVRFTTVIIAGLGIVLLASGLINTVSYFRKDPASASKEQLLAKGLIMLLTGAFCIFRSDWFFAAFPLLTLVYGIAILLSGFVKIQSTVDALRLKQPGWLWRAVGAASSILLAIIIILNPFSTMAYLWIFVGISLIAEAVLDLITIFVTRRTPGTN